MAQPMFQNYVPTTATTEDDVFAALVSKPSNRKDLATTPMPTPIPPPPYSYFDVDRSPMRIEYERRYYGAFRDTSRDPSTMMICPICGDPNCPCTRR